MRAIEILEKGFSYYDIKLSYIKEIQKTPKHIAPKFYAVVYVAWKYAQPNVSSTKIGLLIDRDHSIVCLSKKLAENRDDVKMLAADLIEHLELCV